MPELVIAHSGVKERSGRYKWGSGDRPYQRLEKSSSRKSILSKIREEREFKARQKENDAKKRAAAERKAMEEKKDQVLKSGSATDILKYEQFGMLTNKQLKTALDRIDTTSKLKEHAAKETQSNMQKIDKYMKDLKMVNSWSTVMIDTYNTVAKLYNTTESGRESPLPIIGGKTNQRDQSRNSNN